MKMIYDPPGGPRQEWEFEAGSFTIGESIELEDTLGMTLAEAYAATVNGSVTAMRYFMFIMRRRSEPDLRLENLNNLRVSAVSYESDKPDDDEGEAPKDETPGDQPGPETSSDG